MNSVWFMPDNIKLLVVRGGSAKLLIFLGVFCLFFTTHTRLQIDLKKSSRFSRLIMISAESTNLQPHHKVLPVLKNVVSYNISR